MDKHDRPYKCTAEGCEKLPGFTYSGGLLRHEREVHGKHGGPKNPLHCPHTSCKRHAGKGFSRQENLNEHLRRVHTQGDGASLTAAAAVAAAAAAAATGTAGSGAGSVPGMDSDDESVGVGDAGSGDKMSGASAAAATGSATQGAGRKRKRSAAFENEVDILGEVR